MCVTEQKDLSPSKQSLNFVLWAFLGMFWWTFGLGMLMRRTLYDVFDLAEPGVFPSSISSSIWLAVFIIAMGFMGGAIVGGLAYRQHTGSLALSAVLGYELAVLINLVLMNAFPTGQLDAFDSLVGVLLFKGMPSNVSFFLIITVMGAVFVVMPLRIMQLYVREMKPHNFVLPALDSMMVWAAAFLPAVLVIGLLGLDNLINWETVKELKDMTNEPIILLGIDAYLNPAVHMLMAAMAGAVVALSPRVENITSGVLSVAAGMVIYITVATIAKEWLVIYALPSTLTEEMLTVVVNTPKGGSLRPFTDTLDLHHPPLLRFGLLWFGTVVAGSAAAFAVLSLRLSGPQPAAPASRIVPNQ